MSRTTNARARQQAYRHSPEGRLARSMYNQKPEVRMKKALKRAMKKHTIPTAINFGSMMPHYPKVK